MDYKTTTIRGFKALDDDPAGDGIVEAYVAVTGLKDNVNDIILPGAFQKSLIARNPKGVWHHNITESVSRTLSAKELPPLDPELPDTLPNGDPWPREAGALLVKTQFNLKTQRGRDAYEDVLFFGPDQEWSIGYNVKTGGATIDKKTGTRMIAELDLYEYSPVLFGAMPNARTASVKDAQLGWKTLEGVDALEIKSLVDEYENREPIEFKGDVEDDEDDEGSKPSEDDTTAEDQQDKEQDDEEEEDDEKEEKSFRTSFQSVEAVDAAIAALENVKAMLIDGYKDQAVEEGANDLVALCKDAGIAMTDQARAFDEALGSGDLEAMEAAGNEILDAVEEAFDDEEADADSLNRIPNYIASAFQQSDEDASEEDAPSGEEGSEEKGSGEELETKTFDLTEFAGAFED